MKFKLVRSFSALVVLGIVLSGCASTDKEILANVSFDEANRYYAKGKFEFSQKKYQEILDEFPDSPLRLHAMLGSADSYYMQGEYFLAAPVYKRFQELYPLDERTPHALFYEGMSYYRDIKDVPRDQSITEETIEAFTNFVIKYPDHPARDFAKDKLNSLEDILAQKQLFIIEFYYRIDAFGSCIGRVDDFVAMFPGTKYVPRALLLKGKSLQNEEAFGKAKKVFEELVSRYGDTEAATEAKIELKKMNG